MTDSTNVILGYSLQPSLIELTGRDRLKWLHSFVTNEIRNLTSESWQETFVTDSKGKSFSHGCVFMSGDALYYLSVSAGQEPDLMAMWDRYIISEDVTMRDASPDWTWLYVSAGDIQNVLSLIGIESQFESKSSGSVEQWILPGSSSSIFAIHGFALATDFALLGIPRSVLDSIASQIELSNELATRGLAAQSSFPWFGIDFSKDNLPQEVDRDSYAISFKKGCYLGQETIARLDALGQVQKKLFAVSLRGNNEVETPSEVFYQSSEQEERATAGVLTSAYKSSTSPDDQAGFAMIRRKYFTKINELTIANGLHIQPRSMSQ